MGRNTELFQRHPIQMDGVTIVKGGHTYVRDRKGRVFPNKAHAWKFAVKEGISYLAAMEFTYAGEDSTNYVVLGLRALPRAKLISVNAMLYERLLVRDAAGAKIIEDPLFREVLGWICGIDEDASDLREKHRLEHEVLMDQYGSTGVLSPRAEFVAGHNIGLVDIFEAAGVTAEEASVLPLEKTMTRFMRHDD